MDDAGLVDAELDTATFCVTHGLGHVKGHGAGLRVGHEPSRTKHATETADLTHEVGCGNSDVEVEPAALDPFCEVVRSDRVRTGGLRLAGLVTLGEGDHPHLLTGAVRKNGCAADHLVGVLGVDAHSQVQLDRRVELGLARFLDELRRFVGRVFLAALNLLRERAVALAVRLRHGIRSFRPLGPPVCRAVGAT